MGANAEAVAKLQPDYLGYIFWEPSARYYQGKPGALPGLPKIGVFVDSELEDILDHLSSFGLDGIQLHGNESPAFCKELRNQLEIKGKKISLIKAFQIDPEFQFEQLNEYAAFVDYFLFDAKGELPGGNGIGFNWELLNAYQGALPYFLSGGIGPDDIEQILTFLTKPVSSMCHAIDVNSGFEIEPGLKNIERLEPFLTLIQKLESDFK